MLQGDLKRAVHSRRPSNVLQLMEELSRIIASRYQRLVDNYAKHIQEVISTKQCRCICLFLDLYPIFTCLTIPYLIVSVHITFLLLDTLTHSNISRHHTSKYFHSTRVVSVIQIPQGISWLQPLLSLQAHMLLFFFLIFRIKNVTRVTI